MDTNQKAKMPQTKLKNLTSSVPVRIGKEVAKTLKQELTKLNKKSYGRKVKASELIKTALKRLTSDDRKNLQEATLSSEDRFNKQHKEYCQLNGNVTKSEFINLLLPIVNSSLLKKKENKNPEITSQ